MRMMVSLWFERMRGGGACLDSIDSGLWSLREFSPTGDRHLRI